MKLYYAPTTISIASVIALDEAGIEFEPVRVDFANAEQTSPAYHAINPKGRVPALITDHGVLTETGAILGYIAACAPDAGLVPDDPFQAARMQEVMYYLASTAHVNHAHKMRGHRWADDEAAWASMKARVQANMTACAAFLEEHALTGPFVLGTSVCLADAYLFAVAQWLPGDGVDLAGFPKLSAFCDRFGARPSVARVRELGIL